LKVSTIKNPKDGLMGDDGKLLKMSLSKPIKEGILTGDDGAPLKMSPCKLKKGKLIRR
jgi:hypothetical protein